MYSLPTCERIYNPQSANNTIICRQDHQKRAVGNIHPIKELLVPMTSVNSIILLTRLSSLTIMCNDRRGGGFTARSQPVHRCPDHADIAEWSAHHSYVKCLFCMNDILQFVTQPWNLITFYKFNYHSPQFFILRQTGSSNR